MESIEYRPETTPSLVLRNLRVGESIILNGAEHSVERIESGSEIGKQFGLQINRDVPVYYLSGMSADGQGQGGYQPDADVVVIYENNIDPTTLEHELIHAVEFKYQPTAGLLALYQKAKNIITEQSFHEDGIYNFNFMKNIHEFLADGRTKLKPILIKEGLYNEFEKETAYIFDIK